MDTWSCNPSLTSVMSVSVTSKNMVRGQKSKQRRSGEGPCMKKNDGEPTSCSWTGRPGVEEDGGGKSEEDPIYFRPE